VFIVETITTLSNKNGLIYILHHCNHQILLFVFVVEFTYRYDSSWKQCMMTVLTGMFMYVILDIIWEDLMGLG